MNEAEADCAAHPARTPPDLVAVPAAEWQVAMKRFKVLKPLLKMEKSERTAADVKRAAQLLGKHPVTVYRWLENYRRCERLSVFLRKERSDRGSSRLANKVEKIIAAAIKSIYLTAEKPSMAAVTEEVWLQCFKNNIKKKPAPNTIRARILMLSDRLRLENAKAGNARRKNTNPSKATSLAPIFRWR